MAQMHVLNLVLRLLVMGASMAAFRCVHSRCQRAMDDFVVRQVGSTLAERLAGASSVELSSWMINVAGSCLAHNACTILFTLVVRLLYRDLDPSTSIGVASLGMWMASTETVLLPLVMIK